MNQTPTSRPSPMRMSRLLRPVAALIQMMANSNPSASESTAAGAFSRLHPRVQRWVWEQGWSELRPAQVAAVEPILAGERDVLISAATASGKTEAAFLPICSAVAGAPRPGLPVLYVSPLKALINDQYDRLEALCEQVELPVQRWHGDVASSAKAKLLGSPRGVLLITPESLEAILVIQGPRSSALFGGLQYVVVDELHSYVGTERGAQLQSLLHRVELAIRRRVPRIALSATLGDMSGAAEFLRPGGGASVAVIAVDDGETELLLQVRGYEVDRPVIEAGPPPATAPVGEDADIVEVAHRDMFDIAEHLFRSLRGSDNLVFANARTNVEIYADLLARISEREHVPNEFLPHHGNLSKEFREFVESRLKDRTRPTTAVCTSTLELGIDIGDVDSIAQVGPPPSVASMRQRLGRSGRRGDPAILRLYISEPEVTERTSPTDALRAGLVQSIAMVDLLLQHWYEAPVAEDLHLSTLIQQLLSLIAQHGGVRPAEAYGALCGHGPFRRVSTEMFASLLRSLHANQLLTQMEDGILLLDVLGERIVNHYTFYAAFMTPIEYRLVHDGRHLGTIPINYPLIPGQGLIFAGSRWKIMSVDGRRRVVELTHSGAGRPPLFTGTGVDVADRVRKEMLSLYLDSSVPGFLNVAARDLLAEGRANFARYKLGRVRLIAWGEDVLLFPWAGDRTMATIAGALAARGLETSVDGLAVTVDKVSPRGLLDHLAELVSKPPPDPLALAAVVANKELEKYDRFLPPALLDAGYAARSLDLSGAWVAIKAAVRAGV